LKKTIWSLEKKEREREAKDRDLEKTIWSLEKKHEDLEEAAFRIRSRFFETYRRDVLGQKDQRVINEGNETAHDGNSVLDSRLYESGYRTDEYLLQEIYGLALREIVSLRKYYNQTIPDIYYILTRSRWQPRWQKTFGALKSYRLVGWVSSQAT
jgi:hypothetical protein